MLARKPDVSSVLGKYRLFAVLRPVLGVLCVAGVFLLPVLWLAVLAVLWLAAAAYLAKLQCVVFVLIFEKLEEQGKEA